MTTHEILVAAKGYLLNVGWAKNPSPYAMRGVPQCVMGVLKVISEDEWLLGTRALRAHGGLAAVADMAGWNDKPGRTFDEVIDAFDRAIIATAPKETPASPSVPHVFT